MNIQIKHISPLQTAKVLAVFYFVTSIPIAIIMAALPFFLQSSRPPVSLAPFLVMPFIYLVLGFLFTFFAAWVYNIIAERIGGIEFTTTAIGDIEFETKLKEQ